MGQPISQLNTVLAQCYKLVTKVCIYIYIYIYIHTHTHTHCYDTNYGTAKNILLIFYCSRPIDERLPDIMWCWDPFMEELNEIEDIN